MEGSHMISNIHFENTRDGSWVLEGRSVQTVRGDSTITSNLELHFGVCEGLNFENINYTCITWLTRSWIHGEETWSSFCMVFGGWHHFSHNQLRWQICIKDASVDFTQHAATQKAPSCTDFCTTRFCER